MRPRCPRGLARRAAGHRAAARPPAPYPNAPRTLDLDLLLYGQLRLRTDRPDPTAPRGERAFVLRPLLELDPALRTLADDHSGWQTQACELFGPLTLWSPMTPAMNSLPVSIQTFGLLALSNVFMTFAWYAHLRDLAPNPGGLRPW